MFASDLSFANHITTIICRAQARVNIIFNILRHSTFDVVVKCYTIYIRPILEYATMVTKKKARKNEDFKKVKLKVGKKLKKTTTTDTTIKAKRVVLATQLEEKQESDDNPLSFRGLTLDELCKQMGHFNSKVKQNAIQGLKQILTSRPDLVNIHLRSLVPCVAVHVSNATLEGPTRQNLLNLYRILCTASTEAMSAHITLFLAHVLRALTNIVLDVRHLALSTLSILLDRYPSLCRNHADLFPCFINYLASSKRLAWNKPGLIDTIIDFINVYDTNRQRKVSISSVEINFEEGKVEGKNLDLRKIFVQNSLASPFDFGVVSSSKSQVVSPFELPEALLNLSNVLAPIISNIVLEDTGGQFMPQGVKLIEAIVRGAENQPNEFLMKDFKPNDVSSMQSIR
uniref:Ipi1_N domain-containing protein n=2 Tax=Caenorhabditis japonica TaxID=281687 RepID=A0A8R1DQR3_CAEJA